MDPQQVLPFKDRLRQLRKERGLSQEALAFETRNHGKGITTQSVRWYEGGRSRPAREVYESLAGALGIKPGEFPEYRLLVAREALDETLVGLEPALATLEAATSQASAAEESPAAAGRPKRLRQRHSPQAPAAPRKKQAGS